MSTLPNMCLGSTTFEPETVKIKRPRRAQSAAAEGVLSAFKSSPVPRGWRKLARLDWRKAQSVRIRYSGGSDPHVVVQARGAEWSYPWDTCLLDVLADVCNRPEHRTTKQS